ncbi:MAG: MMPL family protein [Methanomassiliicoccales archaeon PtaU1.Bin124]|nr:MAG: MMPL family protein [Methanomassiliicoccales archaeon PtaU1.Bin124]
MSRAFNRLGKFITRRYKLIIVVWLLALLVAIPFAPLANDAVVYNDTSDPGINDRPSVQAENWIEQHFSGDGEGSSIIIVLTSSDVTDQAMKNAVDAIANRLNKASPIHDHELSANATVRSIYSETTSYSRQFLIQMNYEYYSLVNITQWLQTMLFGVPQMHLTAWQQVNASYPMLPTWQKDEMANVVVTQQISDLLANYSFMTDAQRAVVHAYDNEYDTAWSATANDTVLVVSPTLRMINATDAGYASFVRLPSVRSLSPLTLASLAAVKGTFTFETAFNETLVRQFSFDMISARTETAPWLVSQAISYGPVMTDRQLNASVALKLSSLASTVVGNSSLRSFPLPLIPATISTFINRPENDTMLLLVTFTDGGTTVDPTSQDIIVLRSILSDVLSSAGIGHYVTGNVVINSDMSTSVNEDVARIDPITVILVLILIGLFFRSPVASSVPPAIIGFALGMSFAAVYFIGTFVMHVNYTVLTLIVTATLGAGCDYCIFIISRYREERRKGAEKREAVESSVTWAGQAIATSGATVIVGFGALALGRLEVIRSMSILAFSILMALLIALTFLPSILMLIGDRIVWPDRMMRQRRPSAYFTRSAKFAIKHAKAITLAAILISVPTTYVVMTSSTSYDYIAAMPNTESKQGLNALIAGFGGGTIDPTNVGVSLTVSLFNATDDYDIAAMDAIEGLSKAYLSLPNVKLVKGPTRPYGEPIDYHNISTDISVSSQLYDQFIRGTMVGDDNRSVLLTIVFSEEPFSAASIDSIKTIRQTSFDAVGQGGLIDGIYVSGATARTYDVSSMTQQDLYLVILLVIVAIFFILLFVLRSVISPLKSILTILLSISWTLAVTILFFEHVMGAPVMWMVPMVLIVVCLGLGMDYDILLITRIREEVMLGKDNNESITHGLESTGGIITACGVIMAGAFGSMMLSNGELLKEFGFALMFAILLDATVVRIYLVPAIMALMGKWNWWAPGWLGKDMRSDGKEKKN